MKQNKPEHAALSIVQIIIGAPAASNGCGTACLRSVFERVSFFHLMCGFVPFFIGFAALPEFFISTGSAEGRKKKKAPPKSTESCNKKKVVQEKTDQRKKKEKDTCSERSVSQDPAFIRVCPDPFFLPCSVLYPASNAYGRSDNHKGERNMRIPYYEQNKRDKGHNWKHNYWYDIHNEHSRHETSPFPMRVNDLPFQVKRFDFLNPKLRERKDYAR